MGGNLQDLITRALIGALGAVWAGAGYAARNGNPIVMGAFAVIFMIPMIYRFTQSSHPVSLFEKNEYEFPIANQSLLSDPASLAVYPSQLRPWLSSRTIKTYHHR